MYPERTRLLSWSKKLWAVRVHYSSDIPERCNDLIKMLVRYVEEDPEFHR